MYYYKLTSDTTDRVLYAEYSKPIVQPELTKITDHSNGEKFSVAQCSQNEFNTCGDEL